jgi:hypothetical protein
MIFATVVVVVATVVVVGGSFFWIQPTINLAHSNIFQ